MQLKRNGSQPSHRDPGSVDGTMVAWMEHVTDQQYLSGTANAEQQDFQL